jgi:hypothetical protein
VPLPALRLGWIGRTASSTSDRKDLPGEAAMSHARKHKRFLRKMGADRATYVAYREGEGLALLGPRNMPKRLRENPYPPGRRHDEWERGYQNAGKLSPI